MSDVVSVKTRNWVYVVDRMEKMISYKGIFRICRRWWNRGREIVGLGLRDGCWHAYAFLGEDYKYAPVELEAL